MTLSTYAPTNAPQAADRRRSPVLSKGQIVRLLVFWLAVTATILVMDRPRNRTAEAAAPTASAKHQVQAEPSRWVL